MHDDPSGKGRLQRTFKKIVAKYKRGPDFIAFEWAQSTYTALASKRDELRQRLSDRFPQLDGGFIARFASTLAYEGDLQQDILPSTKLIWILDGRSRDDLELSESSLVEGAINRKIINALEIWLLPKIPGWEKLGDEAMLENTTSAYLEKSRRVAGLCHPDEMYKELAATITSGRETHMFNRLLEGLTETKNGNRLCILIIGTGHLLDFPGSLFNLCRNKGFDVEGIWPHEQ